MEGFQENPSISTTGTGRIDRRIDEDAQAIDYRLSYEDLEGVGTTVSSDVVSERARDSPHDSAGRI
jgi:hypothetical protein